MLRFLSATVCALVLSGATVEDGQAWLQKAEQQLYRWPAPHAVVHFQAHTDALATLIGALKRDLAKQPDAEGSRFVAALEKAEVSGSIDTATGRLETEVAIDFKNPDAARQKTLDTIRQRLQMTLNGCFASLPLQDPSLLRKGSRVDAAEEAKGELLVTSNGVCTGDKTVLHFAKDTGLPKQIELPQMTIDLAYSELYPGAFAPSRLDLLTKGAPASRIELSWQHEGDVWFPEHVHLSSKGAQAKIDFDHLEVAPRKH